MCRCRGSGPSSPTAPAEIAGYLALADAQPTAARRMRAAGLVCLGAGAGLIRADLRAVRGTDVICRSGGLIVAGARRPAAGGAGPVPLPRPAAGRGALRRDRAGLRRGRSRPPEHHHPADPVAGRRDRAAPAGHVPAARHLAGRDCAELLGLATFMHAAGITCSQRLGDLLAGLEPAGEADAVRLLGAAAPAMIPLPVPGGRSSTAPASRRGSSCCCPSGCAPGSCWSAPCCWACCWCWPITGPPT